MTGADTNHHPPHSRDCVFVCGSSRIPQNKIIQKKCCGNIKKKLTTHSHRYVWCSGTNFLLLQMEVIYWARSVPTSIISTNHHHDNSLIPTVGYVSDWERERESWWMEGRWGTPHYSKFKDNLVSKTAASTNQHWHRVLIKRQKWNAFMERRFLVTRIHTSLIQRQNGFVCIFSFSWHLHLMLY